MKRQVFCLILNGLGFEDSDSELEQRWVLLGMSEQNRLLVVVYTLRENEIIRLISARKEVKQYER
ncbi:BrnT family toxin [Glaciecola sp. 1036]|uniref:BrnT family toxin n=1 Tax=Alteromonadaceae TaxID=72275 RepID=UPI003D0516EF